MHKFYKKISIIIPTYNRKKILKKCLESLVIQDYPKNKIEILVIDNNPNFNTKILVESFYKKYSFVKHVFEKKQSSYICRNKGLKIASGDIICFLDDDCTVGKNWLKKINEFHIKNKNIIVIFQRMMGCSSIWEKAIFDWSFFQIEYSIKKRNTEDLFFPTPSITFKRKLVPKNFLFREWKRGSDVDFAKRLISLGKYKYYDNNLIYHHNITNLFTALSRCFLYGKSGFKLDKLKNRRKKSFTTFPIILFIKSFKMARISNQKNFLFFFIFIFLQVFFAFGYIYMLILNFIKKQFKY